MPGLERQGGGDSAETLQGPSFFSGQETQAPTCGAVFVEDTRASEGDGDR